MLASRGTRTSAGTAAAGACSRRWALSSSLRAASSARSSALLATFAALTLKRAPSSASRTSIFARRSSNSVMALIGAPLLWPSPSGGTELLVAERGSQRHLLARVVVRDVAEQAVQVRRERRHVRPLEGGGGGHRRSEERRV